MKINLSEQDSSSPQHDALVLWIVNQLPVYISERFSGFPALAQWALAEQSHKQRDCSKTTARCLLEAGLYNPRFLSGVSGYEEIAYHVGKLQQESPDRLEELEKQIEEIALPQDAEPVQFQSELEVPVKNNSPWRYIDVVVTVHYSRPELIVGYDSKGLPELYADTSVQFYRHGKIKLRFDAKPSIPSHSQLLRQINTFRQIRPGHYVVVSPDVRFRGVIESQQIEFWESTPDSIVPVWQEEGKTEE
jgi:hypothetical protein